MLLFQYFFKLLLGYYAHPGLFKMIRSYLKGTGHILKIQSTIVSQSSRNCLGDSVKVRFICCRPGPKEELLL